MAGALIGACLVGVGIGLLIMALAVMASRMAEIEENNEKTR